MAKVKLNLQNLTDADVVQLAEAHVTMITGNAAFPAPLPDSGTFASRLTAFTAKRAAIATAESALAQLYSEKADARDLLESALSQRASYVESAADGDAALIQSAGLAVQSTGSPTSSLTRPENVTASVGDDAGEIDVSWNRVERARNYIVECRLHPEGAVDGPWQAVKIVSRSKFTVTGLVSGSRYAFRVRALGPNNVESPWSDEAVSLSA